MIAELLKYASVFFSSMLKFVAGPAMGAAMGLSFIETTLFTVAGMMTTVMLISLFGPALRKFITGRITKKRTKFSPRNRKFVIFWKSYGILGVAFLTPVLFSPVLGSLLLNSISKTPKTKIISYMLVSAVFWSFAMVKMIEVIQFGVASVRI